MRRILLQPAYVLHRRAYRESSFLLELFTKEHGRLTVIARGIRKSRSSSQGILQPFVPLLVSFAGRGELMTLSEVEATGEIQHLHGECLFAGFYLNELLTYLLQKWDAHSRLYAIYEISLRALQKRELKQQILRSFEKAMLEELGYGLLPTTDFALKLFSTDKYYRFIPEQGFVLAPTPHSLQEHVPHSLQRRDDVFSGKSLLAIAKEDWQDEQSLQDAKRLMRLSITFLLGKRPLYSRKLFI
jgi:DNA repair protein RecO (recombination protein O)